MFSNAFLAFGSCFLTSCVLQLFSSHKERFMKLCEHIVSIYSCEIKHGNQPLYVSTPKYVDKYATARIYVIMKNKLQNYNLDGIEEYCDPVSEGGRFSSPCIPCRSCGSFSQMFRKSLDKFRSQCYNHHITVGVFGVKPKAPTEFDHQGVSTHVQQESCGSYRCSVRRAVCGNRCHCLGDILP
jgi:hypothetical protein